jgi:hypothetical protein
MTNLVRVELRRFPLDVYLRATEHHEELMREFALLALAGADAHPLPRRLIDLMAELTARYAQTTAGPDAARDAAIERGDPEVDLVYHVPEEVRDAVLRLGDILDEADGFCRAGEHLLTLAAPPEALRFRKWYLGEFLRQLDGHPPTPWPQFSPA